MPGPRVTSAPSMSSKSPQSTTTPEAGAWMLYDPLIVKADLPSRPRMKFCALQVGIDKPRLAKGSGMAAAPLDPAGLIGPVATPTAWAAEALREPNLLTLRSFAACTKQPGAASLDVS